jgi:hypothetical protein
MGLKGVGAQGGALWSRHTRLAAIHPMIVWLNRWTFSRRLPARSTAGKQGNDGLPDEAARSPRRPGCISDM